MLHAYVNIFSLLSRHIPSSLLFLSTHHCYKNQLFDFHVFADFPVSPQLLSSVFIPVWSKMMLCVGLTYLCLLRCVYVWIILWNFPVMFVKNVVHSSSAGVSYFQMVNFVQASSSLVDLFLLFSKTWSGISKYSIIISSFMSSDFAIYIVGC